MTKTGAAAGSTFEDGAESAMDWARNNSKMISIGVTVVAAVVVIAIVARQYSNRREDAAEVALSRARQSYAQGNLPLAQTDLRRVISQFGGSSAGSQASMLLAQAYYEQGKADSGLKALEDGKASSSDRAAFEALKGAGFEQKKDYPKAAERYKAASEMTDAKMAKDRYMADAARAYTSAGNKTEAAKIWESMSKDAASPFSSEAKVRLGELVVAPAGK